MHFIRSRRFPWFLRLLALVLLVGGMLAKPIESFACDLGDTACISVDQNSSDGNGQSGVGDGDDCCPGWDCDQCCAPCAITLRAAAVGTAILVGDRSPPLACGLFEPAPLPETFRPPIVS